jgi:DNA helicase-2/ATP-dependent DNA helicase PcrA
LDALPQPIRIADDWEERHIILEDLKGMLNLARISDADALLAELSADWQSLTADEADWDQRFPNPAFHGAWREHRITYGYTLRAELVYQLKRALEVNPAFDLENGELRHLLVDEYQDLNRCDLAVVQGIAGRNVEVFAAGDDDQSIYGFRKAHPEGIRRFTRDYHGAANLTLATCVRCDSAILDLALFVARQDYGRLEKPIHTRDGSGPGEVALLRFSDEREEARGVAALCRQVIAARQIHPHDVLILLRTDRNGAFSSVLQEALLAADVPVALNITAETPLDGPSGRQLLALLRLARHTDDNLSWRTLIQLGQNNLGGAAVKAVYDLAQRTALTFAAALRSIAQQPALIPRFGNRLATEHVEITRLIGNVLGDAENAPNLRELLERLVLRAPPEQRPNLLSHITQIADEVQAETIADLLAAIEAADDEIEQELKDEHVNILTMHRAKGLTARVVIVVAAEDEYLPGRALGEAVHDERRLLYVSLTRARESLFITFCGDRVGAQRHTGRTSGRTTRTLTRFLRDAPIQPRPGIAFVRALEPGM